MVVRRCPTLPHPPGCSTIGAVGLSFRVRNGTGRFPHAITTVTLDPATTSRGGVGNLWGHDTCPPVWCQVVWTTMVLSIYVCLWTVARTQDRTGCGLLLLEPYSRREHALVFLMIVDDALCTHRAVCPTNSCGGSWWAFCCPPAHTPYLSRCRGLVGCG